MKREELKQEIARRWPAARMRCDGADSFCEINCSNALLAEICGHLFLDWNFSFAGLIVDETADQWQLRYCFYGEADAGWVHVVAKASLGETSFPSIVHFVHAADWHEREAEDLFGLHFEGHPRLGDFVLHNNMWQENVAPMRRSFDPEAALAQRKGDGDWRPRRILHEAGAFAMPIGPKYSGVAESVHFLLETVGEDVVRAAPRLFYKWRAIEKLAEGKSANDVLLLAERFSATTAFAHGLAFCQAVESVSRANIPPRARLLRVFLAELERLRQHAGAVQEICESTGLVVANSQAGILEEDLLRTSCELTGHRYLFGFLSLGGLLCDLSDEACGRALAQSQRTLRQLNKLQERLRVSSSFLDRLEEVGFIAHKDATAYGLLGPIARASSLVRDLRRAQPYSGYEDFEFDIPSEREGDGYARLRVLFAEARQSVRIMEQTVAALRPGSVCEAVQFRAGESLGWAEAPRGGAFHWARLNGDGRIARYRIVTPSFANWHGFHLAVENFAFQDFPIILSTFDFSVAENDR
jgi:Ni,Fe-hydrogenase III large subunit/NADH:ubiquinone oxidoreductase subunit C